MAKNKTQKRVRSDTKFLEDFAKEMAEEISKEMEGFPGWSKERFEKDIIPTFQEDLLKARYYDMLQKLTPELLK